MHEFLAIHKALSDGSRVRALMALTAGELCVCQVVELLKLAPSTVSKHMAVLHQAGLVETRKDGRWVYYRLAEQSGSACARAALSAALEALAGDARIREDKQRLKSIRRMSREELCARGRN
jgi:DNA-binding transcriptional ArsR family regulator